MRFRQVHLDFHTSELIPGIGSRFDADAFGRAFALAHVDSVTIFSKCHHGHSYHPTEVGGMHPHLDFDLTRAQLDALHAHDIKAPVYLSATFDEYAARAHPEWRIVEPDGKLAEFRHGTDATCGWAWMDYASPYLDYLVAQVDEVMRRYPDADGIFLDISFQIPSVSEASKRRMDAAGLDWTRAEDRDLHTAAMVEEYFERVTAAVRAHDADMPLFFNSGHMRRGMREHYRRYYTHLELESLPTAHWGYEHFPLSARYVDPLGIPFLGMTGKFHSHWGEVGGYKTPDALVYECGAMIAQGARCSIGDHLHPDGAVDGSSMGIIGAAFDWVERREPWCLDSDNLADIGLLSLEAVEGSSLGGVPGGGYSGDEGAVRVLLEGKFLFDVLDLESDFDRYRLLILPDAVAVDPGLKARLEGYVANGGRVLLTGRSGIDADTGCVFDTGAVWDGASGNVDGDYLLPIEPLRADFVADPLFMYGPVEKLRLTDGESLGAVHAPYFDRGPRHFSGHINTPSKPEPEAHVAGTQKGGFTQFAFPIFTLYQKTGAVAMQQIAGQLIARALDGTRLVETTLPMAGRVTLRRQAGQGRDVLHLLHAAPVQRGHLHGNAVQPIQDLVPLAGVEVTVQATSAISAVRLVPEGQDLPFEGTGGAVRFTVPQMRGHQMVELLHG